MAEAIGDLLMSHPEAFGVEGIDHPWKQAAAEVKKP
jgi:hypothetical protein